MAPRKIHYFLQLCPTRFVCPPLLNMSAGFSRFFAVSDLLENSQTVDHPANTVYMGYSFRGSAPRARGTNGVNNIINGIGPII